MSKWLMIDIFIMTISPVMIAILSGYWRMKQADSMLQLFVVRVMMFLVLFSMKQIAHIEWREAC